MFTVVGPVIIVSKPAQARLNTSDDDRRMLVSVSDQIAIHDNCIIRTLTHLPAGRIGICVAALFGYRIMIDHGIHITAGYKKPKPRFAEYLNAFIVLPVGLWDDADRISV